MKTISIKLVSLSYLLFFLSGCVDPYYSGTSPSYGGGYNNGGYYGNDYDDRRERYELERERERLEDERERLEEEREREEERNRRPPPPPPPSRPAPREERCPSGFSPSENKCTQEERRRGCKDMRLPGGLGCVKR